jgi:hypothetical protein
VFEGPDIPDSVVNNLLFRYKFEDNSTTGTAADESSNNNDGTINGATYDSNTEFGSFSLSFDGSDYVEVPVLFNASSFTLMGWVNKDDQTSGQYILDSEGDRTGIGYEKQTANGYGFYMYDGSSYATVESGNTTTGSWVFLAARWDGEAGEMEFWTGDLNNSITSHGTAQILSTSRDSGNTSLGSVADTGFSRNYFSGRQDEMILCDAVISESDIESTRQRLL